MARGASRGASAAEREEAARRRYEERRTIGKPHPSRARQFMPFAALRGYYDMVGEAERVTEPRRPLSDEEARALDETVAGLGRGTVVKCTFYEDDAYETVIGAVSQNDMIYHDLWIVRRRIPYDEICALEIQEESL